MNYVKRILLSAIFAFLISYIIYLINWDLGNSFEDCFKISALLFLNIMAGFMAYFFVSDLFSNRWTHISKNREGFVVRSGVLLRSEILKENFPDTLLST
ncbi:MAG: hypothetical protein GF364_15785, partial [Candidatus Lokiarchaeota archaeon]|nr:hypothetical protein [Candidatus Lokiarchaeota archaeon]